MNRDTVRVDCMGFSLASFASGLGAVGARSPIPSVMSRRPPIMSREATVTLPSIAYTPRLHSGTQVRADA